MISGGKLTYALIRGYASLSMMSRPEFGSTRSRPGKKTSKYRKGKQCCFIARAPVGETVYPTVPNALTNLNGRGIKLAD